MSAEWIKTAKVGDKVTPIAEWPNTREHDNEILPKFGEVYTIRSIEIDADGPGIRLIEIVNQKQIYRDGASLLWCECNYAAAGFRPVEPRKTDISIFTGMLNPKRATEPA